MQPQDGSSLQELHYYLIGWHRVCDSIEQAVTTWKDSPLVRATQSHLLNFIAKVRSVADGIVEDECSNEYRVSHLRLVASLNPQIVAALDVLEFCRTHERHGHDGELNALYARLNLSGVDSDAGDGAVTWKEKARDVRFENERREFARLARALTETMDTSQWVAQEHQIPDIEFHWSEFSRTLAGAASQLSPRYIHPYATTAEVPYQVDPSGTPSTGSFGTVQKVTHRQLGGPFAQKTFRDVFSASTRRQILREVGVLEVCRHPNIVEFVEAFEVGDQPETIHIVMSPWAPLTLLQFLRGHETRRLRCPWARVDCPEFRACIYRIMYELADAVGYLHGLSIKHKDIKLDNVLLHHGATTQVVPLLADVGVSKVYKAEFETDYLRSSYQYLAPEQLESRESSLKADVWQLGCCFAMIAVVASGGKPGLDRLWTSFEKSDSTCLTNISTEHGPFMRVLEDVCAGHEAMWDEQHVFQVVSRMLDLDSSRRVSIETVLEELDKLPRHPPAGHRATRLP